jgi:hypothetical protein
MPGIDSSRMAEVARSDAAADVLAGVLGVLPGEGDEQPAAALTKTHPATRPVTRARIITYLQFDGELRMAGTGLRRSRQSFSY